MSTDQLAAIGAFLSGAGSMVSAVWFVRRQRRLAEAACDKRIAEFERALHEGAEIAKGQGDDAQAR